MPELRWEGKYDADGRRVAPVRVALPFQTVETVNESVQERQRTLDFFSEGRDPGWRNRLVWGDKKYVLPALLPEFQGKVDLIYIDPPFDTGADFSMRVRVGDDTDGFTKLPSMLEQRAYRDTWGQGMDSYLTWLSGASQFLFDLLSTRGSLFVHLDWHVGHYAKVMLDEVFGRGAADGQDEPGFRNEIVWCYSGGGIPTNEFPRKHDVIFWYTKGRSWTFNTQYRPYSPGTVERGRTAVKGPNAVLREEGTPVNDWWPDVKKITSPTDPEKLYYDTQKSEELVGRIVSVASNPGDLILDCFVGSGTTPAVAEKLQRRWIAADLSRFAVHLTRKRLLSIPGVRPFVVQNLGKYERQAWQMAEFGSTPESASLRYRNFILQLFRATPMTGYNWIHGMRAGRVVHVGAVDAPVSPGDVQQMAVELAKLRSGSGSGGAKAIDVLGWDFAFELNELAKQQAARAGIELRFFRIPHDVMDKRAVAQGDISFFELAALSVKLAKKGRAATVTLTDFIIPLDDVPEDFQKAVKDWSEWIDYWAIDWDNRDDTFHNVWQTYRSRSAPKLERSAGHEYDAPGQYTIVVKVIDILGNDTTKTLSVAVK